MNVGFTGTREGLSDAQRKLFAEVLAELGPFEVFGHGACLGADEQAAEVVHGIGGVVLVAHPSTWEVMTSKKALDLSHVVRAARRPLDRNWDIVSECDVLIACPKDVEERDYKSGTWATIRAARRLRRDAHVLYPDGSRVRFPGKLKEKADA